MVFAILAAEDATQYFFAYIGIASALVFANLGASYGTAKSAVGISSLAVIDHTKIFQGLIPIIMAGILGIYGVIIAVIAGSQVRGTNDQMKDADGYKYLGAGLACDSAPSLLDWPLVSLVMLVSEPMPKLMLSSLV